jgi:hypothetical protein
MGLGLTGYTATVQAKTGWLLNHAFITETRAIHANVHPLKPENKESHLVLLSTVGATNTPVEILCEKLATDDGLVFANEKAEGLIFLLFTKCETSLKKVKTPPCKPIEPIEAKTKFHAILHTKGDKKTYILFEPHEKGRPLATIEFGEECSFGNRVLLTGDAVAECLNEILVKNTAPTDYCLDDLVHHLIQEAPAKLFELEEGTGKFHELAFGAHTASLDGIADVSLSGEADMGATWAVHI